MELLAEYKSKQEELKRISALIVEDKKEKFKQYIGRFFENNNGVFKITSIEYVYEEENNQADVKCIYAALKMGVHPYYNDSHGFTIDFDRIGREVKKEDFFEMLERVSSAIYAKSVE